MIKHILLAALLLPTGLRAQEAEIFIPSAPQGATQHTLTPEPKPSSALTRCLASPDANTCASARIDDGVQTESAVPQIQFETLVLDLDGGGVTSSPVAPAQTPDDTQPPQGRYTLPAVAITIEFDFDSARIRADQFGKMAKLTEALSDPALRNTRFAVIGHTDASGAAEYNCTLSQQRAGEVAYALQSAQVPVPLIPVGFGEEVLKDPGNPRGAINRRVTFLRLPDAQTTVLQTLDSVCGY
jgi:outer membrane protein OmpA-like peptidoglycan-associated protein